MGNLIFIQSKNWGLSRDLNWIIKNASFVFTHTHHNGMKPHIVTKEKVDGYDCFEVDNDCDGIILSGWSKYSDFWKDHTKEKVDTYMEEFIGRFLVRWGAGEFVHGESNSFKEERLKNMRQIKRWVVKFFGGETIITPISMACAIYFIWVGIKYIYNLL